MAQNNKAKITTFKANSQLDYARPNLFQVDIDWPAALVSILNSGTGITGGQAQVFTAGALAAPSATGTSARHGQD